jgi:hypothetical protein
MYLQVGQKLAGVNRERSRFNVWVMAIHFVNTPSYIIK